MCKQGVKPSDTMLNRQEILQELRDISPLIAEIPTVNLFIVPDGYFNSLPDMILEKIRIEAVLKAASADTYQVPTGYFEGLPAAVLSKIKMDSGRANEISDELDAIAPLLNTISRKEIYRVPAGYFAETGFAAGSIHTKKEAKVIGLRTARRWMQYAAAALVAGVLVTGAFMFTDNRSYLENETNQRLDVSSELNKVSANDLVKYLNNPEHATAAPAATQLASEDELADVKNNIQQLTDEELSQYLKDNAEPFEAVASEKDNE